MRVLITGANGMVARAAILHCRSVGDVVVPLTRSELDIADQAAVNSAFKKYRPEAVLNCAAYTDVDGAESNPEASYRANAAGVNNLALASQTSDSRFLTISTDYVFDGSKSGFYTQRDTPKPQGVYAETKYEGELLARRANAASIIVRSGWIYGHHGTNFLSVMPRLLIEGKTIKAISDSFGTPTFAEDLARRLRELVELDMPSIFHVTNTGPGVSYLEFAEEICKAGGFDQKLVEHVGHQQLQRSAPRPVSSKLACLFSEKFALAPMPEWQRSLQLFVEQKGENAIR